MTLSCIQQPHQHLNANLDNGVLTLAINRPEAKNALYGELYLKIAEALDQADQDKAVRVVILRGENADFSAGNDMQDFMKFIQAPLAGKAGDAPPFVVLKSAARFSKPLICAVRGVAYSTFTIIRIIENEEAEIIQYDNPFVVLLRNGKNWEYPREAVEIGGKTIYKTRIPIQKDDTFIAFSDGAIHAGIGMSLVIAQIGRAHV